ncbi:MAG: Fe-S cluster assembly ATPase SufC [Dehalococcoidia bacterium]|nr:Fe-S cluster assembly ATPase SufC [Dehalococcoidia bacterium]MQG15822.1 Fe-S cluster assembly ATPase SufC [SAR202 cluster bacterium]|tara:strand:+ start:11744 stop:12526 length:783 start_codon:yes stop_codon:yes gene_type:complete
MLEIKDIHAVVAENQTEILKGINLSVKAGEVHAIMGPNGSGKSTLANVLAGQPDYEVSSGTIEFKKEDLLSLPPDERALKGIFLAFQYPMELPGVRSWQFIKAALDAKLRYTNQKELTAREFDKIFKETTASMDISEDLMRRSVNEGFSGGEKKRSEMIQMLMLSPDLAVLDETDSGLDIDALKTVANGVNQHRSKNNAVILVTHYQRLLNYIKPDYVHVLINGKIAKSGGPELAKELESKGYDWVKEVASEKDGGKGKS